MRGTSFQRKRLITNNIRKLKIEFKLKHYRYSVFVPIFLDSYNVKFVSRKIKHVSNRKLRFLLPVKETKLHVKRELRNFRDRNIRAANPKRDSISPFLVLHLILLIIYCIL